MLGNEDTAVPFPIKWRFPHWTTGDYYANYANETSN